MVRGTFANGRIRNRVAPGTEGGVSAHQPDGTEASMYDVAMRYAEEGTPLVVLAGQNYGSGSLRDWAAKGPLLLGIRAVIAETFERIHRSNLIGMGIAPLVFLPGENVESLGLTGHEVFSISGIGGLAGEDLIGRRVQVRADDKVFEAILRIDTLTEADYFCHGGILHYVVRKLAAEG
jgi:aconitate hydratase